MNGGEGQFLQQRGFAGGADNMHEGNAMIYTYNIEDCHNGQSIKVEFVAKAAMTRIAKDVRLRHKLGQLLS
jgi:hypothetical protein